MFFTAEEVGVGENKTCNSCPRGARCTNDRVVGQRDFWRNDTLKFELYACKPGYCLGEEQVLTAALGDLTTLKVT